MTLSVLLLVALLQGASAQCPTFTDSDAGGAWSGFPLASDNTLVLVHDIVFKGVTYPITWTASEITSCSISVGSDGSDCNVSAPPDMSHFVCEVSGATGTCAIADGEAKGDVTFPNAYSTHNLKYTISDTSGNCTTVEISNEVYVYDKSVSLAPLILVLIFTPITQEVYSSLGMGGIIGTWILKRDLWDAWLAYWHDRIYDQLTSWYADILWTMFLMGGIGGLTMRAGGIQGIGHVATRLIKDSFLGQAVVFCLGWVIFMDDYANTIIVGFSLQPVTEAMRVSREKLSFIVDCTASPIAGVMPLSTWIAHEVAQIKLGVESMETPYEKDSAYMLFLRSISRRFYSWFMLTLVATTFIMGRDWGFMYRAEKRARSGEGCVDRSTVSKELPNEPPPYYTMVATENFLMVSVKEKIPHRWVNAILPFVLLVVIFIPLLFYHGATFGCPDGYDGPGTGGWNESARDIIGCAYAFPVMHWTCGSVICIQIVLYAVQYNKEWGGCLLWPREAIDSALNGGMLYFKAMICLLLAFTYARCERDLLLDKFLVDALGDSVSEAELPALVFILCAIFSLATGTSWGTMATFMPIVLPLAEVVSINNSGELSDDLLLTVISAVLGGAVWGDHCSPISDTTILSAAASQCGLMDHTKTQMPYAFFCGIMAILFGFMPCGAGAPPGLCIIIGLFLIPLFHFCITLLGNFIPNFAGNVEVFVPSSKKENDGEGFIIGAGPRGTVNALKNMIGKSVPKTDAKVRVSARENKAEDKEETKEETKETL